MPSLDMERASSLCLSPSPGKMAGIFGDGACGLALRALAVPLLRAEAVVAVDGANRFDPYEISKAARARGGDGRAALSRIRVSRAFTCHQMEALLSRRLPEALSRFDALFAAARYHTAACTCAGRVVPFDAILMSILIEERRSARELSRRLEDLERRLASVRQERPDRS